MKKGCAITASATEAGEPPSAPPSLTLWHLGRRGGGPRYMLELARSLMGPPDVRLSLVISAQSDLHAETLALGLPTLSIDTYTDLAGFAIASCVSPS